MDTKGVITLVFVILILAVGLAVAISKYIQQKKKYEDYTFSKFISDYGANVLALLKDVYETYIKDTTYVDEDELIKAREAAIQEMEQRAAELGANAVVGVDIDYEVLGSANDMLMVTASGTAVVIE